MTQSNDQMPRPCAFCNQNESAHYDEFDNLVVSHIFVAAPAPQPAAPAPNVAPAEHATRQRPVNAGYSPGEMASQQIASVGGTKREMNPANSPAQPEQAGAREFCDEIRIDPEGCLSGQNADLARQLAETQKRLAIEIEAAMADALLREFDVRERDWETALIDRLRSRIAQLEQALSWLSEIGLAQNSRLRKYGYVFTRPFDKGCPIEEAAKWEYLAFWMHTAIWEAADVAGAALDPDTDIAEMIGRMRAAAAKLLEETNDHSD